MVKKDQILLVDCTMAQLNVFTADFAAVYDTQEFPPKHPMLCRARYVPSSPLALRRLEPQLPTSGKCLVCYHGCEDTCAALCSTLKANNVEYVTMDMNAHDVPKECMRTPPPPPTFVATEHNKHSVYVRVPPTQIGLQLLIASCEDMRDPELMSKTDAIVHVMRECCDDCQGSKPQLRIPIDDSPTVDLGPWVKEANAFVSEMHKQGKTVVVHCGAGLSRAPAIVIAYLMACEEMPFEAALRFVRTRRPIDLNLGFYQFLSTFNPPMTQHTLT